MVARQPAHRTSSPTAQNNEVSVMTNRRVVIVVCALLLTSACPATVMAQANRAAVAETSDDSSPANTADKSPVLRFAAAADDAQVSLADLKQPAAGKSVLAPSVVQWKEPAVPSGPAMARSGELAPPDLLSGGPAPAMLGPTPMAEELPFEQPAGTMLDPTMMPSDGLPDFGPSRPMPVQKQPMMRESWLFRPWNISIFEGALFAATPAQPGFKTLNSYFTGFRIGWDYTTHFGGETRFGFSRVFILDANRNTQVGYQNIFYFDSNLLIYPLGDTRWRPFFSIGGGLADILIAENNGATLHPGAFNMPIGCGIKYRRGTRLAFRADIRDNITFSGSGGLATLNNIEVVGGMEFHFGGGERRSYWPWNPSKHWW
jgi:hypothetical protein